MEAAEEARAPKFDPDFERVAEAFAADRDVSKGEGKGFGSGALKVNGKIFAMMASGRRFVVKLPKKRVHELVGAGDGERFDAGGRLMKEWLVVQAAKADWVKLARKSL